MKKYTDKQLLDRVKSLPTFKSIPKDYWILGVRSKADAYNTFDDKFYVYKGEEFVCMVTGTTNSGAYGLKNFADYGAKGVAVVVADEWYYDVWANGKHKGKIDALVQVGGFKIRRDANKNNASGDSGEVSTEYWIGINFHPSSYDKGSTSVPENIGSWSTGCQVVNQMPPYLDIIAKAKTQLRVSYCLLNEF